MKGNWLILLLMAVAVSISCKHSQSAMTVAAPKSVPKIDTPVTHAEVNFHAPTDNDLQLRNALTELLKIPAATLPYGLTEDDIRQPAHDTTETNDRGITLLINSANGNKRSGQPFRKYEFVAQLKLSVDYAAIIYRWVNRINDKKTETSYMIATLDSDGHVIDRRNIAAWRSPDYAETATIHANATIYTISTDLTWHKDPLIYGYSGNRVTERHKRNERGHMISPGGVITMTFDRPIPRPDK